MSNSNRIFTKAKLKLVWVNDKVPETKPEVVYRAMTPDELHAEMKKLLVAIGKKKS